MSRTSYLTAAQMHHLDEACKMLVAAYGTCPYLVGTAGEGGSALFRDVDVRLIFTEAEFAAVCPTQERWELLCLAIGAYLTARTGLPIDFQIQRQDIANTKHPGPRNPLGIGRRLAGGGDGTPPWPTP